MVDYLRFKAVTPPRAAAATGIVCRSQRAYIYIADEKHQVTKREP
jgi:hypothetical protein